MPRVSCAEHGVHQVHVPWAEKNSSFTALFEALVIAWLEEASIKAVAERMQLTWDQVDGVLQRAVVRGLARRGPVAPRDLGVDETSYQKHRQYVTVVNDAESGDVIWVADGHGRESLDSFYETLTPAVLAGLRSVSMDMWNAYIYSTIEHVPDCEKKIAFDRFHIVQHLGHAVDLVRRAENRTLVKAGDFRLKKTKYIWLKRKKNLNELVDSGLQTAQAYALKEIACGIWGYKFRGWARRAWKSWIQMALDSGIAPMIKVAKMVRYHLIGILNADVLGVTNARAESLNSKIQKVKRMACGFRNRKRFRNAIYFHLGGLDMSPQLASTHTRS